MKYALLFVLSMALTGCAGYQQNAYQDHGGVQVDLIQQADNGQLFDAQAGELERRQKAGEITQLQLSKGLFEAQQRYIPEETAYGAYLAYRVVAAQQLDSGKITLEEFQAKNQALFAAYADHQAQQRAAQQANYDAHAQAQAMQRAATDAYLLNTIGDGFRNAYQPPPRTSVNCMRSPLGGAISTTCY